MSTLTKQQLEDKIMEKLEDLDIAIPLNEDEIKISEIINKKVSELLETKKQMDEEAYKSIIVEAVESVITDNDKRKELISIMTPKDEKYTKKNQFLE